MSGDGLWEGMRTVFMKQEKTTWKEIKIGDTTYERDQPKEIRRLEKRKAKKERKGVISETKEKAPAKKAHKKDMA